MLTVELFVAMLKAIMRGFVYVVLNSTFLRFSISVVLNVRISIVMLNVVMLSVIMYSDTMLSATFFY